MMDFHSHLDLYPDALKLLPEVAKRNTFTLAVTTSPRAWLATSQVFSRFPNVEVALGMHPEVIRSKAGERQLLLDSISQAKVIGEVGLDGSQNFKSTLPFQKSVLNDVFKECESNGGRILSIHSRGAASQVLDLIEKFPGVGFPILHWFSGSLTEARRAVKLGCWFSVNPVMLKGAKGKMILSELPLNRVLPETDGPFTSLNSKILMPWDAMNIVPSLIEVHGMSKRDHFIQLEDNMKRLLRSGGIVL